MKKNERRTILKAGLHGLVTVPVLGGLASCSDDQQAGEQAAPQIIAAPTRLPSEASQRFSHCCSVAHRAMSLP